MPGWIGLLVASAVWIASAGALAHGLGPGLHTSSMPGPYPPHSAHATASSSDLPMVLWCTAFTFLQLTSFLLFAFVFRAAWRLRTAVCFTLAAGLIMVADAAGLLALLVWLGLTLGAS